jgi:hypothetical protein
VLYDKICREDILRHAYGLARANAGAAGVDGVSFAQIEASGLEAWLAGLREDLVAKTYRPDPVRRVLIPKPDGGERPLGIPTIRDRVVQTAAKLVLEPIFEADFEDTAYGYRPARGAVDAVKDVHRHLCRGYTDVVDADLSKYFDTIPHAELLRRVARRIVDRHVLRLIKMWLKAPIEERDSDGKRRIVGDNNRAASFLFRGGRRQEIIGLIAGRLGICKAASGEEVGQDVQLVDEFGIELPAALVVGKRAVAIRRLIQRIPSHQYRPRTLGLLEAQQKIGEPHDRAATPVAPPSNGLRQRMVGTMRKVIGPPRVVRLEC